METPESTVARPAPVNRSLTYWFRTGWVTAASQRLSTSTGSSKTGRTATAAKATPMTGA